MALRTVRVPAEFEGLFVKAEELVSRFFQDRKDDPRHGTIEIFGERYILVRAASLSVEFFSMVTDLYGPGRGEEADAFSRNILFDLAHAIGRSDAANFHARMKLEDPIARLSAGPVHFAHAGWAFVDIFPESRPSPDETYYLVYDHPYSFESDAWMRAGKRRDFPVCIMNAGYSSGWCEESFGVTLVASEILCRARGDEACRFIMAHPARIEDFVSRYRAASPGLAPRLAGNRIPDFFARKRMEEELRRSHDELEQRVRDRTAELEASNERLRSEMAEREDVEKRLRQAHKLEAIGRLAGGVAHDFNNLMGVVLTRTSLIQRGVPQTDKLWGELQEIRQASERAAALTKQLLAFGRGQVQRKETLDLNRIVSDLGRTIMPLIGEDVELITRLRDGVGSVEADRGQLEQVIMNLAVNARDAMPKGGTLTLETARTEIATPQAVATGTLAPGSYVLLTVADTGCGMDEETLTKIFDPFFTTKTEGKGTGLGLSTAYGTVQQMGGAIAVQSAPGLGTRFALYFPTSSGVPERVLPQERTPIPRGHETILLVEDQPELRRAVSEALRAAGYEIVEAAGPFEALELLAQRADPVQLLVTDVVMPRMNGRELADRVRALRPAMKTLFISGYAPEQVFEGRSWDAASFLAKPFLPDELAQKVRQILDT